MGSRHTGTTVRSRGDQVEPLSSDATPSTRPGTARRSAVGRRRPAALLAALVVGGVAAAVIGTQALPSADAQAAVPVAELLGSDAEGLIEPELSPQEAITEVEAQARLDDVAASRAQRAAQEQAASAAAEAARPKAVLPIRGARMTTCFCMRWGTMHWGIDLAAPLGTPIVAAADGVVLRAGPASGYGNAVYIQDADGNVEIYGHMRYMYVEAGDVVSAGDTIAKVGSEGQSTGPHLHFEIHKGGMNGKPTDPQDWLADRGITVG